MKEVEVKFLDIDVEKTQAFLESIGAKQVFDGELSTQFFQTTKPNTTLRIRTTNKEKEGKPIHILTYKEKSANTQVKEAEEYEVGVLNKDKTAQILEHLGYPKTDMRKKRRISYKFRDWSFEIDFIPDCPPFLEIEGHSQEHIQEAIKLLNLNPEAAKPWSGKEVIAHYSKLQ